MRKDTTLGWALLLAFVCLLCLRGAADTAWAQAAEPADQDVGRRQVRLTFGLYTHVELHDRMAAIGALPGPPGAGDKQDDRRTTEASPNGH